MEKIFKNLQRVSKVKFVWIKGHAGHQKMKDVTSWLFWHQKLAIN